MQAVTGVFISTERMAKAVEELNALFGTDRVMVFSPETRGTLLERVPVTEDMSPVGAPIAAAILGGLCVTLAVGFLAGLPSPLVSIPLGALIGAGGAALGWWMGREIERYLFHGVPVDELFIYQDALEKGRGVVVVLIRRVEDLWRARHVLEQAGAESVDQARQQLWLGLRSVEEAEYWEGPEAFQRDEAIFRKGFESALTLHLAGQIYSEAAPELKRRHGASTRHPAFERGFARGQLYRLRRRAAPARVEPEPAAAEEVLTR